MDHGIIGNIYLVRKGFPVRIHYVLLHIYLAGIAGIIQSDILNGLYYTGFMVGQDLVIYGVLHRHAVII